MHKLRENQVPSYRLHKQSGQAIVTLSGRDILLGKHGSGAIDIVRSEPVAPSSETYDRRNDLVRSGWLLHFPQCRHSLGNFPPFQLDDIEKLVGRACIHFGFSCSSALKK